MGHMMSDGAVCMINEKKKSFFLIFVNLETQFDFLYV